MVSDVEHLFICLLSIFYIFYEESFFNVAPRKFSYTSGSRFISTGQL